MKYLLIPALIAHSQEELDTRLKKISVLKPSSLQLDIMDGTFVPHTSLEFDFNVPKKYNPEAHLMVRDPHAWMLAHHAKVPTLLVHYESKVHLHDMIKSAKVLKKKIGLALNPDTPIEAITQYLPYLAKVTLMTVNPGAYGAPFIPAVLEKIKELRVRAPKLDIEVDGGITPGTLARCKEAGANQFVIGSHLQNAKDVKKAWKELRTALKN